MSVSLLLFCSSKASRRRSDRSTESSQASRSTSFAESAVGTAPPEEGKAPPPAPPADAGRPWSSWQISPRKDSQSIAALASACFNKRVWDFERYALSLANSWAKDATSSSMVSTFRDNEARSLEELMDRSTADSRTSASRTNFAIRSFIAEAVLVAVSKPVLSACSSTEKRCSHDSDKPANRSCCFSICLSNCCCKFAKAKPDSCGWGCGLRPSGLKAPAGTSPCSAAAAVNKAVPRSRASALNES
mmetsp:Transcript_39133/g.112519  ORF Transcript_39133/g.112519 Transcript_39133/m.112519 type:complete len:246 (+) Transcript_39133:375-1112(+)